MPKGKRNPKTRLTAAKIKFLKPTPGAQVDYYDSVLPGFLVRVSPTGAMSFGVVYRRGDKVRRMTFDSNLTLKDARKKASGVLREVANDKDPAAQKAADRKSETFEQLAAAFMERWSGQRNKAKTQHENRLIIDNKLVPALGALRAKEVTRAQVRELVESIAATAPTSANRTLACVRKIFNWALSQDLVEVSPCHGIAAPSKERRRERVFAEDEIKALWAEFGNELSGPVFKLLLLTAQRSGEVRSMRWADVDLKAGWWTVPAERAKNGMSHRVPLSPPAVKILEEVRQAQADSKTRKGSPWVFPAWHLDLGDQPQGTIQKSVEAIRVASGVADFRAHDLRRTAASLMTGMGVPRLTVSKILNHAEPGVTAVYDRHSYDAEKREALGKWARRLMVLVSDLQAVPKETDQLS
jgi:integrase